MSYFLRLSSQLYCFLICKWRYSQLKGVVDLQESINTRPAPEKRRSHLFGYGSENQIVNVKIEWRRSQNIWNKFFNYWRLVAFITILDVFFNLQICSTATILNSAFVRSEQWFGWVLISSHLNLTYSSIRDHSSSRSSASGYCSIHLSIMTRTCDINENMYTTTGISHVTFGYMRILYLFVVICVHQRYWLLTITSCTVSALSYLSIVSLVYELYLAIFNIRRLSGSTMPFHVCCRLLPVNYHLTHHRKAASSFLYCF